MLRKSIMFFVVLAISVSVDAFAVPSVKKLGSVSVSSGVAKTVSTLPKAPVSVPSGESLQTKSVVAPATREIGDANARLSAGVNSIKTISSGKITSAISEAGQHATMSAIDSAVERIGALESDVDALESDVGALDSNVAALEEDVSSLESSVSALESGVSGAVKQGDFNSAVARIGSLEEDVSSLESNMASAVKGVSASGTGNYVSNVSLDGDNKINVTKTSLLYAPVRQGTSDTIVSNAEIWLVK